MAVIHRTDDFGVPCLALVGAFTLPMVGALKDELLGALDAHGRVRLDLSGVDDFDSSAVQLLLFVWREAARRGLCLEWADVSPVVVEVLQLLNLGTQLGLPEAQGELP